MKKHAAPMIVAALLLLLLYVGSYLALVKPGRMMYESWPFGGLVPTYRCGEEWSGRIFWPLEQIDRQVRPKAWSSSPYDDEFE